MKQGKLLDQLKSATENFRCVELDNISYKIMGNPNAIAVGCAVGIPIGIGIIIAAFFWIRLQRRFKKEDETDIDLNRAVYDDDGSICFDNLSSMQDPNMAKNINSIHTDLNGTDNNSSDVLGRQVNEAKGDRKNKCFIPAYKRRNLEMRFKCDRTPALNLESTFESSKISLGSSPMHSREKLSVFDQMVPVLTDDKVRLFQGDNESGFMEPSNNNSFRQSSQAHLINSLNNNNNFGSYYPRSLSFSNVAPPIQFTGSNTSVHTRASSMNSILKPNYSENIFSTSIREHASFSASKTDHSIHYFKEDNHTSDDEKYNLKNNYDNNFASKIAEEDQYENDYTNYSQSKREFIDSLRPKKIQ